MEEYLKINWRENPLDDDSVFITEDELKKTYMNRLISGEICLDDLREKPKQLDSNEKQDVPGQQYYHCFKKSSQFNANEHGKFINALKVLVSGKKKHDYFERQDLEFYNNCKQQIVVENSQYLKFAEELWNKTQGRQPLRINNNILSYMKYKRKMSIENVFKRPKNYNQIDLLSYSHEDNSNIEMIHTTNLLDMGKLGKFLPPDLTYSFKYKVKTLPKCEEVNYNSKLPVSEDKNIDGILDNHEADVVLSLSTLKKLINFSDSHNTWHVPVIVKKIVKNGKMKNVVFLDKALPKLNPTHTELNERCAKLFAKTNFCTIEGYAHQTVEAKLKEKKDVNEDTLDVSCSESEDEETCSQKREILHNTTYKLWQLGTREENNVLLKGFIKNSTFKVLIRTKYDACEKNAEGNLQPITIVPKIEYQLDFGGGICSRTDLVKQWASLYFKPFCGLYRIRSHYSSCDVVKIEPCSIQKVANEAMVYHQCKPNAGIGVLYKIFHELRKLPPANYLLHREPKQGAFVALLQETVIDSKSTYDLHEVYKRNDVIVTEALTPWCQIDVNVLLPMFEHKGHMAGLFQPCKTKAANKFGLFTNKNNKGGKGNKGKKKNNNNKAKNQKKKAKAKAKHNQTETT
ncbi:PREDICTED: uncharacterized protein LOC108566190 [Nicrophorus vespilloides]|uniref:Uncharacterized protein LOC108566190 n=1 Tax=Nicrophorus vespilloides TaxID=110193 RepID=A0ABM1N3N6_NICVS|nr:PREDICTED: uncharacterized protein LOC108566190 [Nicrophorus vespilloides]